MCCAAACMHACMPGISDVQLLIRVCYAAAATVPDASQKLKETPPPLNTVLNIDAAANGTASGNSGPAVIQGLSPVEDERSACIGNGLYFQGMERYLLAASCASPQAAVSANVTACMDPCWSQPRLVRQMLMSIPGSNWSEIDVSLHCCLSAVQQSNVNDHKAFDDVSLGCCHQAGQAAKALEEKEEGEEAQGASAGFRLEQP